MVEVVFLNFLEQIYDFVVLQYKSEDVKDIYILGKKLGEGQFGIIYLCMEKVIGFKYVCKCILK